MAVCDKCQQPLPEPADAELIKRRNRRIMAWIALISNIVIIFLALFYVDVERLKANDFIVEMFLIVNSGIVATYMGSSAWITTRKR